MLVWYHAVLLYITTMTKGSASVSNISNPSRMLWCKHQTPSKSKNKCNLEIFYTWLCFTIILDFIPIVWVIMTELWSQLTQARSKNLPHSILDIDSTDLFIRKISSQCWCQFYRFRRRRIKFMLVRKKRGIRHFISAMNNNFGLLLHNNKTLYWWGT